MRKDKKQVIGDEIGDEQIKLFLDFEPVDATSPSLHKLVKAYRGLRIDDFERFLTFFVEAGLDLNGKDEAYVPLLFRNELEDYVMRERINAIGRRNLCATSVCTALA